MFEPDDKPADGTTLVIDCRSYAESEREARLFTSLYKSVLFLAFRMPANLPWARYHHALPDTPSCQNAIRLLV